MQLRIRPNVLQMQPYSPGKPIEEVNRELGLDDVVKLASNENPWGPSPKAAEAVQRAALRMHLYPDASAFELKRAIAAKFGVKPEEVLLGNGSDELIHLLGLVFLSGPADKVVVGYPSFVRYDAAAHLADSRLVRVPLDDQWRHDLPAMAAAVDDQTRLVFVANPNNPTGTIVRRGAFDRFLEALPPNVPVVLDEAYWEFAQDEPEVPCSIHYLRAGKPVIGLRTFSKAYGLAGVRVGYGFAPEEVVDAIDRAREPFNVNSLAQTAALAALDDAEHLERVVKANREGLSRITDAVRALGCTPVESFANFICIDVGRPAQDVFQSLLLKGVIVRSGGWGNSIRVSIGTPQEVDRFLQAFQEVMT